MSLVCFRGSVGSMATDFMAQPSGGLCPACYAPIGGGHRSSCPGCGIDLNNPAAAELYWIVAELGRLDAARATLSSRRAFLLGEFVHPPARPQASPPLPPSAL